MEIDGGHCDVDYLDVTASRYAKVDDHTYAKVLNDELKRLAECPARRDAPENHVFNLPQEGMQIDPPIPIGIVPLPRFDAEIFEQCKGSLPHTKIKEINVPAITTWLEVIR